MCCWLQDWKLIELMHVFQEQLITARGQRVAQHDLAAHQRREPQVDLQNVVTFEEHFYLVVVEKLQNKGGSVLHMWRVVIASQGESGVRGHR